MKIKRMFKRRRDKKAKKPPPEDEEEVLGASPPQQQQADADATFANGSTPDSNENSNRRSKVEHPPRRVVINRWNRWYYGFDGCDPIQPAPTKEKKEFSLLDCDKELIDYSIRVLDARRSGRLVLMRFNEKAKHDYRLKHAECNALRKELKALERENEILAQVISKSVKTDAELREREEDLEKREAILERNILLEENRKLRLKMLEHGISDRSLTDDEEKDIEHHNEELRD